MKYSELRQALRDRKKQWCVYLVECKGGSYYCGITNDINRRISEHNSGKGAKYTKSRRPVKLLASVVVKDRSAALKLEAAVKKKRKQDKISFLVSHSA
jgi:putative endonuclease